MVILKNEFQNACSKHNLELLFGAIFGKRLNFHVKYERIEVQFSSFTYRKVVEG